MESQSLRPMLCSLSRRKNNPAQRSQKPARAAFFASGQARLRLHLGLTTLVLASCWLSGAAKSLAQEESPTTFDYEVKEGDSCVSISREHFGDPKAYKIIHQFNPDMGPTPHHLRPGKILKLPRPKYADAEITSTRHEVKAREGQFGHWLDAKAGLAMFRGWRVRTFAASFADLRFVDTSTLSMAPNTLIVIYGANQASTDSKMARASLSQGRLRARLGELAGEKRELELSTPSAKAQFEGGETLVEVAPDGQSRVENHGSGSARVSSSQGTASVRLAHNTGTKVNKGERPLPPRVLPAPPQESRLIDLSFATPQRGARATLQWNAVPEAVAYRVELYRESAAHSQLHLHAIHSVDAASLQIELQDLRAGRYAFSVSSIDSEDFSSRPSESQVFQVVQAGLRFQDEALPLLEDESRTIEVPFGATLDLSPGADCKSPTIGLAHPKGLIVPGRHEVYCKQGSLLKSKTWTLAVAAPAQAPRNNERVHLLRPQSQERPAHKTRPLQFSLGSSLWLLERTDTDPNAFGSPQRLPTSFLDLAFHYSIHPWLAFGIAQHLAVPRSFNRNHGVMLGGSLRAKFTYSKWRIAPIAELSAGLVGLIGSGARGVETRKLPLGIDLGVEAPVYKAFVLGARAGFVRMVRGDFRYAYSGAPLAIWAGYRFGSP